VPAGKQNPRWSSSQQDLPLSKDTQFVTKKFTRGGGGKEDVRYPPTGLKSLMEEQEAWEDADKQYNSLDSTYKSILPSPGTAPVTSLLDPFIEYMSEKSDEHSDESEDPVNEAQEAVGMLSPDETDEIMREEGSTLNRIKPYYKKAFPNAGDKWIPILIRASVLQHLLK
jgi:hypothetical protein